MTSKEKKRTSSKIWRLCTSKKLALWLIILLTLLSTMGMIIPQETYNPQNYSQWANSNYQLSVFVEKFQLHKIFKSYIFLFVSMVFTLNLVFCTIEQIKRGIKILRVDNANLKITKYPNEAMIKINTNISFVKGEIIKNLRIKRFRTLEENNVIYAEKGRFGIWGATIFHIGLITVIVGGLFSNYFSMSGYFQISEGEVFQETHNGYLPESLQESPFFNEEKGHNGYQIKLDKQERFFKDKRIDYTRSIVLAGEKEGQLNNEGTIERGQPFEYKGSTFYHKESGYSPEIKFKRNGQEIGGTYFSVETKEIGKTNHFTFTGDLNIFQNEGYIMKISYYPDLIVKGNAKYDYDSMEVNNPAIYINVYKNGKEIFHGLVKKDQWVKFDKFANFEISLGNTVYWVGLDVVKDPGANILFLGFCISLLGLIILYSIVPKRIVIELREENLETICLITGRSRKYQLFFKDEFNKLVKKIGGIRGE